MLKNKIYIHIDYLVGNLSKSIQPNITICDQMYISKAAVQGNKCYIEYNLFFKKRTPISVIITLKKVTPSKLSNISCLIYFNGMNNFSAILTPNAFNVTDEVKVYLEELPESYKISIRTLNKTPAYENYFLTVSSITKNTFLISHDSKVVIADLLPEEGIQLIIPTR